MQRAKKSKFGDRKYEKIKSNLFYIKPHRNANSIRYNTHIPATYFLLYAFIQVGFSCGIYYIIYCNNIILFVRSGNS